MTDTTAAENTKTGASQNCSADQEKNLCSEHGKETRFGYGDDSEMPADKRASTAPSSEMRVSTKAVSLSDRLTPSLISAGLVKGTTRTFGLRLWRHGIRYIVLYAPDGSVVELPNQVCLF